MIYITADYLIKWVNELAENNKIYKFYQSRQWRGLREDILIRSHNECYMCRSKGKITEATTVHHIYHLRKFPQYGLSEYIEVNNERIRNLIPLCNECHNKEHPEKFSKARKKKKPITLERW